jgi:hypothetical protein
MSQAGLLQEAEEMLLRSIELCLVQSLPIDQPAMLELVSVLERKGDSTKAARLRAQFKSFSGLRDEWLSNELGEAAFIESNPVFATIGKMSGTNKRGGIFGLNRSGHNSEDGSRIEEEGFNSVIGSSTPPLPTGGRKGLGQSPSQGKLRESQRQTPATVKQKSAGGFLRSPRGKSPKPDKKTPKSPRETIPRSPRDSSRQEEEEEEDLHSSRFAKIKNKLTGSGK